MELQLELKKLKEELETLRLKLEENRKFDEDKLALIKLQN